MPEDFDLLAFIEESFMSGDDVIVAGQMAKITDITKTLDDRDVLTLNIEIMPLRVERRR